MLVGSVIAGAGLMLSATVTEMWQLYITFGLTLGFGHAFCFPPGVVIISKWFGKSSGLAIGIGDYLKI